MSDPDVPALLREVLAHLSDHTARLANIEQKADQALAGFNLLSNRLNELEEDGGVLQRLANLMVGLSADREHLRQDVTDAINALGQQVASATGKAPAGAVKLVRRGNYEE